MDHVNLHLDMGNTLKGALDSLDRALDIALKHNIQISYLAFFNLGVKFIKGELWVFDDIAALHFLEAYKRDLPCLSLILDDGKDIPGSRDLGKTYDLNRRGRASLVYFLSGVVDKSTHLA